MAPPLPFLDSNLTSFAAATQRLPCHVYQGPSTTSTKTRIGAIAGECHNNELREAHREAEEIGDSERAKKTRRALETIERKERVKAEMIERSFQFVHECPGKAVSPRRKFQLAIRFLVIANSERFLTLFKFFHKATSW